MDRYTDEELITELAKRGYIVTKIENTKKELEKPEIDAKTLGQLETIRQSGKFNMFNYHAVLEDAGHRGFQDLVGWMKNNKKNYLKGIMRGFDSV